MKFHVLFLLLVSGIVYAGSQNECQDVITKQGNGDYILPEGGFSVTIDKQYSYVDMIEDSVSIVIVNDTLNITRFYATQDWNEAKMFIDKHFKDVVFGGHAPKNDVKLKILKTDTSKLNGMECITKEYTYMTSDGPWKGTIVIIKAPKGVYQLKYDRPEYIYDQYIDKVLEVIKTVKPLK